MPNQQPNLKELTIKNFRFWIIITGILFLILGIFFYYFGEDPCPPLYLPGSETPLICDHWAPYNFKELIFLSSGLVKTIGILLIIIGTILYISLYISNKLYRKTKNLKQQFNQISQLPISSVKPKFNVKYVLIVLILSVVVVGILIWQYPVIIISVEQPISETAGWQVYRNKELGIEFKYPKSWGEVTESRFQGPTECELGKRIVSGTEIRLNFSKNSYISPDITLYFTTPNYKSAICFGDKEEIIPGPAKEKDLACKPYPIGISRIFECNRISIADSPAISWYDAINNVQACGYMMAKHIEVISPSQNFVGVNIIAFIPGAGYDTGCYEEERSGPDITLEEFINMRLKQLKENQLPSEAQQFLREFDNFIKSIKFV